MAEEFADVGRGITLCYEEFGSPGDPAMLLVMGLATQMIGWPDQLCEGLAEQGFRVVRFDNRDCGRSTHMSAPPPRPMELVRRRVPSATYMLSDMATDAVGLMKVLDIQPAHIVGVSMGGMIAQTIAAEHPGSVRSLVSIMSTTGDRFRGQPALGVYQFFLRQPPRDRDGYIERLVALFGIVGSPGFPRDEARLRELAGRMWDRDHDASGPGRQLGAIVASGDRTAQLRGITAPTLVIHGTRDRMVRKSGGRATSRAIPGARLVMIDGMGHDLPEGAWPRLIELISAHANAAALPSPAERSPLASQAAAGSSAAASESPTE